MTRISGRLLADSTDNRTATGAAHNTGEPPGATDRKILAGNRSVLRCHDKSASAYGDSAGGIYVVIEGSPLWKNSSLAGIAKRDGNGAALMSAYKEFGTGLFRELSGTFALAIIDENHDRALLAVDRMGARPLCYAFTKNKELIFGSTTDSIITDERIDDKLSVQAIYEYIYFNVVPSPSTIYENIFKLEPAQFVLLDSGSIRKDFFWRPVFSHKNKDDAAALQKELVQKMRSAVDRTLVDKSTGAFLSGGLDSSTVCGLANEKLGQSLRAYTIGFEQQGYDEMAFARIAAKHFGLSLREYYVTPNDVADALPVISAAYDEPFGNSSAVPAYFCAKVARSDGTRCLLAGDGGDELFAGNERYAKQKLFEYYRLLPSVLRNSILEPACSRVPANTVNIVHKIRRYIEQARVPLPERLQTYNFLHMKGQDEVFEPSFLDNIDRRRPVEEMNTWFSRGDDLNVIDKMLVFDWKLTLADNDLRKVNRMCEIAGIQVYYPFLDDDLVDFSTKIPASLKLRNRQLRYFFKKTFADYLPQEIIQKQKHGFGLPFGDWLITSKKLRDVVIPSIDNLAERGIFRKDFLASLLASHQSSHAAFYGNIIWVLVMLEHWFQAHGHAPQFHRP